MVRPRLRDQLLLARVDQIVEAYRIRLRVQESLRACRECLQLGRRTLARRLERQLTAGRSPRVEHRDEQILATVELTLEVPAPGRQLDVVDLERAVAGVFVQDVTDHLIAFPAAADLEDTGVGDLDRLLAQLDRIAPVAALVTVRAELVDAAERGLIERGDELRAHTPHVDLRTLLP